MEPTPICSAVRMRTRTVTIAVPGSMIENTQTGEQAALVRAEVKWRRSCASTRRVVDFGEAFKAFIGCFRLLDMSQELLLSSKCMRWWCLMTVELMMKVRIPKIFWDMWSMRNGMGLVLTKTLL